MAKFAVYYVPPADSKLYQRGSEILGYDVRAGEFLPVNNATRAALPEFVETWIQRPQTYGFHVTVGYSLYFEMVHLPAVEQTLVDLLNCFSPGLEFLLTPDAEVRLPFWNNDIIVLHCHPNPAMLMLHTMITARVNPFGSESNMSHVYANSEQNHSPVNVHRVRQYHTSYILDGWIPHFTLMMPYTGQKPAAMRTQLEALFSADPIPVKSISLLVMPDGETHYRMHREFHFADFPRPIA